MAENTPIFITVPFVSAIFVYFRRISNASEFSFPN